MEEFEDIKKKINIRDIKSPFILKMIFVFKYKTTIKYDKV